MRIDEIPEYQDKNEVLRFNPEDKVMTACKQMADKGFGACLVVDEAGKLCGIFTERDLLNKVVSQGLDIKKLTMKDVMTKNVKVAHPYDSVNDSLRRMSQGKFRHLPVVDDNNEIVGFLSQGDFVALTWSEIFHHLSRSTKSSFKDFTQIWVLFIVFIIYSLALVLFLNN